MSPARIAGLRFASVLVTSIGLIGLTATAAGQSDDFDLTAQAAVTERLPGGASKECPYIDVDKNRDSEGCVVRGKGDVAFTIMTPFGRVPLADCVLRFKARTQFDGEIMLHELVTEGDSPCGDVFGCNEQIGGEQRPWTGVIEPVAKTFELRLNACLDTCAGWFEGPLKLRLKRVDGAFRAHADGAEIGDTGLAMTGSWKLAGDDLTLERVDPY